MKIKDFLFDVCEQICRPELVSSWEDRLLAEDIQTVGELKSLHQDDWNRLASVSIWLQNFKKYNSEKR